jgi:hypothetical protein
MKAALMAVFHQPSLKSVTFRGISYMGPLADILSWFDGSSVTRLHLLDLNFNAARHLTQVARPPSPTICLQEITIRSINNWREPAALLAMPLRSLRSVTLDYNPEFARRLLAETNIQHLALIVNGTCK